jgi:type II secretory pathway component GspD/PulD (secretin)
MNPRNSKPTSKATVFLVLLLGGCQGASVGTERTIEVSSRVAKDVRAARLTSSDVDRNAPLQWTEPVLRDERRASDRGLQSFSARDADIRDVLLTLFENGELNLLVAPEVSGRVTFDFKATSQEEALLTLTDLLGLTLKKDGDFVVVEGAQTRTFKLDYVFGSGLLSNSSGSSLSGGSSDTSASSSSSGAGSVEALDPWEELEDELEAILGQGSQVTLKPQAGTITVRGSTQDFTLVEDYLQELESSLHRQVVIEAEVLEVNLNDEHRLGVAYAVFPDAFPSDEAGTLDGGAAVLTNLLSGGTAFQFGLLKTDRYGFMVDALKSTGQVRVLSRPRVATLNNQPATITVAQQVPVIERTVIDGQNTRTDYDIRFEEAGVVLQLLPQISANGDIVARISPRITDVVGQVVTPDGLQVEPILSVRETSTTLRIRDGQSVVIGGLRFQRQSERVDKIPFLGDIPILGIPFRRTIQSQDQIELVIVLTPHFLTDERQEQGLERARRYITDARRPFNFGLFFESPPDGSFFRNFSDGSMPSILEETTGMGASSGTGLEPGVGEPMAEALSARGMAYALVRRAMADARSGKTTRARLRMKQAREYDPLGGWTLLFEASLARNDGDLLRAERLLSELHQERPGHPMVAGNLAILRYTRGDWLTARALLEEAVVKNPEDTLVRTNLAALLTRIGRGTEAVEHLQEALRTDPGNVVARGMLDRSLDVEGMVGVEPVREE